MMMIGDFKKDINISLKEIQKNTCKQVKEIHKEETQKKSFKNYSKTHTHTKVKEFNKTIQDLKLKIQTIKKSQREITLEIENPGKRSGDIDESIKKRMQEIQERISGTEDTIEHIERKVKQTQKMRTT
jgi:chromosome segregation ATPase